MREAIDVGTTHSLSAIDLFCGAGGFSLGLQRAGYKVLLAVDFWQKAIDSYQRNFSHPARCADLASVTGAELLSWAGSSQVDMVVGGPPCQGFSIQRVGEDEDHRNNLVLEYARLLGELSPRLFVLENVPGLIGKRGGPLFERFLAMVDAAGFATETHVLDAAAYAVPQHRRRIVVLGWRRPDTTPFTMTPPSAAPDSYVSVRRAFAGLPAPAPADARNLQDPLHKETRLSELNRERLRHIPPGGGMTDLPVHLRADCHKGGAERIGHRYVYGRLNADRPAATITARFDSFTRGRFAHPFEDRNITLREGARLQSFPDAFAFCGNQEEIAAQIGNAVPPLLAEAIATAGRNSLIAPFAEQSRIIPQRQMGLFATAAAR